MNSLRATGRRPKKGEGCAGGAVVTGGGVVMGWSLGAPVGHLSPR